MVIFLPAHDKTFVRASILTADRQAEELEVDTPDLGQALQLQIEQ